MASRRRLPPTPQEITEYLDYLQQIRDDGCVEVQRKAPYGSPLYQAAEALRQGIDQAAGVLTGDPKHFHIKLW